MASNKVKIDKRVITFKYSDSPLTSKRVSIILSSREDSAKLAGAVRALRFKGKSSFKLTKFTEDKIKEETIKLEKV